MGRAQRMSCRGSSFVTDTVYVGAATLDMLPVGVVVVGPMAWKGEDVQRAARQS
jgi:hypothetical protein